jgi:hypothetical protein
MPSSAFVDEGMGYVEIPLQTVIDRLQQYCMTDGHDFGQAECCYCFQRSLLPPIFFIFL